MTHWTVTPLARSLGPHAQAWDALNERAFGDHPFLTSLFVNNLLGHFGSGAEHLCSLEADGRIEAMCILRKHGAFAWASFLPGQAQIAPSMVPDPDRMAELFAALPGAALQIDLLCNDPALGDRSALDPQLSRRADHALTMRIALDGSFEAYWAARPGGLRSNLRRYEARLQVDGISSRFVRVTAPAQMAGAVERYAALEGAGWKGKGGTALRSTPEQFAFYLELMQRAAELGDAAIFELWFDDQLAASRMMLRRGTMCVMLKTSYDENRANYAPGRLLLRAAIEDIFVTDPGSAIEFYTDANRSQLEWATDRRWIQHLTVYQGWPAQLLVDLANCVRAKWPLAMAGGGWRDVVVKRFDHPDALPSGARRLMGREERRNMGFGFDWFANLVATVFTNDPGVRFYTLEIGDAVRAVVPMRAAKIWLGWRLTALSNFYTTLYEPMLDTGVKAVELTSLFRALRREFPGLASVTFGPMDRTSHGYLSIRAALHMKRWFSFEYFSFGNWFHPVSGSWASYLATRDGRLRNTIKRLGKKFADDGGSLQLIAKEDEVAAGIAAYEAVYAVSWKQPEPYPAFMPGLLQICARNGSLRLGVAWLDGKPVAAQAWIVAHGRAEIYKMAYDEQFKQYSPGTLVTAMLMAHVMDVDRVGEIDYLSGDDAYKKNWMTRRRERWGIIAYNPRTIRGLLGLAREVAGKLGKYWKGRLQASGAVAASEGTSGGRVGADQ